MAKVDHVKALVTILEPWYPLFAKIDEAVQLQQELAPKDEVVSNLISYFAGRDETKVQDYLQQESEVKGNRAYIMSRLADEVNNIVSTRKFIENQARDTYDGRIEFWNESNAYTAMLKEQGILKAEEHNASYQVGKLCLAVELPDNIINTYNTLGSFCSDGKTPWEHHVSNSSAKIEGIQDLGPRKQIPREIWNDLDALNQFYIDTFKSKNAGVGGGIWRSRSDILSGSTGLDFGLYAVKEGDAWTTHLQTKSPAATLSVLSKLAQQNHEQFKTYDPNLAAKRAHWQVD